MADSDTLAKVSFPVKASVLVGILVVVLSCAYGAVKKSAEETIVFFTAASAAAGAILGAFYTARSLTINMVFLEKSDARQKKDIALQRAARWNDPALYHVRETVRQLFETPHTSPDFTARLEKERTNVIHFLNLLEEIAMVVQKSDADEQILREMFSGVVSTACSKLHDWMVDYRKVRGRPKLWVKLDELNDRWK